MQFLPKPQQDFSKIYMEKELEQSEEFWKRMKWKESFYPISGLTVYPQSSRQCGVDGGDTHKWTEKNRDSRSCPTLAIWFLTKVYRQFNGSKRVFSTNGAGTAGHPRGKWTLHQRRHTDGRYAQEDAPPHMSPGKCRLKQRGDTTHSWTNGQNWGHWQHQILSRIWSNRKSYPFSVGMQNGTAHFVRQFGGFFQN